MNSPKLRADFNGLFGELLCLSHRDTSTDEHGAEIRLREGMTVTAFDEDTDEAGRRDHLLASGVVERAPEWLACKGSRWVLRIDSRGVHHQSDLERV